MNSLNRRTFIKTAALLSSASLVPKSKGNVMKSDQPLTVVIPMPIQIVIDDVGWWSGKDGHENQEPFRTGIKRNHVPEDYEAIIHLGKALGIRPQAAMVMCEWDTKNILRELPNSTWMGKEWNNEKWVGPWLEKAADLINNNSNHIELTVHGIGHEYWTQGVFTRAEWADMQGVMRPPQQVKKHLEYFGKLLDQHGLGPMPRSFVPTAFRHGFGQTGDHEQSLAAILKQYGIDYINTPFRVMANAGDVQHGLFGIDSGVLTVDRGQDLLTWDTIATPPSGTLTGPTCGMHWPNILHTDPDRNHEIVEAWIRFLEPYDRAFDTTLAPDSDLFRQQLLHHQLTGIRQSDDRIEFDFSRTDALDYIGERKRFFIKVLSPNTFHFKASGMRILEQKAKRQENGQVLMTINVERDRAQKTAIMVIV